MDAEIRKIMRQVTRERMYALWEQAKEKDFEGLEDEDLRIAKIMVVTYQKLLKKYKTRNPQKFSNLLENEPLLSDA